jgi:transcriptional regulator with XRE-family HTH domain
MKAATSPGARLTAPPLITPDQCRAARGLIDISRNRLAAASGVSLASLYQFENDERRIKPRTQQLIRSALEVAGIEFIPEDGGGPGVRLRRKDRTPSAPPTAAELERRMVGPEEEARGGHEADGPAGPTVPGLDTPKRSA